ncbi:MAG TPA: hypothetical protein PLL09_13640 [Flavobacterium sp.]|uniref:hypothetical protein n=1 Tax=unclassified Flavobacterium TaxID=196869 RepID=UPI0025C69005|nr:MULTISPECIES: hypothetical protein [unclassified Flavobacterium]HRE78855.1 hypothetical protein [Flavobacterium sp.]
MTDVRYTAIGYSNEISKILTLEIGIPANVVPKNELDFYNLSVKLSENHLLNVLMVNLKRPETEFQAMASYEYKLDINLNTDTIISEVNVPELDLSNSEILFLLVHDNLLSADNIREIKSDIFKYYGMAKIKSNYISEAYQKGDPILGGKPRTVGMSIIKR